MLLQLSVYLSFAVATSLAGFCHHKCPREVIEVIREPYYYGRPAGSVEVIKKAQGPFFEEDIIEARGYAPSYGRIGQPWYSPYVSEIDLQYPVPVPRKSIDVKVDIPRDPYVFPPRAVAVSEKVKAPSVAVKERETLISGHERERSGKIIPVLRNGLIKEIDLGCY